MKGKHNKLKRIIIGLGFLIVFVGLGIFAYMQLPQAKNTPPVEIQEDPTTQYTIDIMKNGEYGQVSGNGEYNAHSNNALTATANDGYQFIGWYDGDTLLSNENPYTLTNLEHNYNITARFEKINTITYVIDSNATNTNPTSYTIASDNITLQDAVWSEHIFHGWYTGANGTGTQVIVIDTSTETNYTIYAYFTLQTYTIEYILDQETTNPNPTSYTIEDENITLIDLSKNGYTFHGWYTGANGTGTRVTVINTSTKANITIYSHFIANTYSIDYVLDYEVPNPNPTIYTIEDEDITLLDLTKNGYTFQGWYTAALGLGTKVTTIETSSMTNYTLYSRFTLTTYSITYITNGGTCTIPNPTQYTIYSSDITLHNPSKDNYTFIGWTSDTITTPSTHVVIEQGSYGDLLFTAHYESLTNTVNFYADNQLLTNNQIILPNTQVTYAPTINASEYGMSGYIIDTWYTDNTYTQEYEFGHEIHSDVNIYGKWTYFIDYGFYKYYDKFAMASTGSILPINSYNELVAWADWVNFYNITNTYRLQLNYADGSYTQAKLTEQLSNAISDSIYPIKYTGLTSYAESSSIGYIKYNSDHTSSECTKIADPYHASAYTQLSPAFAEQLHNQRANDYDDFNRNKVQKTIIVSTSDQLFFALETGFKPICAASSAAETLYNVAKNILKDICNDLMTDIQKTYAIYTWLINEVAYDNYAASSAFNNNPSNLWPEYDSWYADGALISKEAVCDGISKAFVVLAQIENIPAIRVTGNSHAWNRVYIDGHWQGLDATHGGSGIQSTQEEVFSLTQFLFTDTYKTSLSFTSQDFDALVANTQYDFYENYDEIYGTNFDLCIDNQNEFNTLCEYLYNNYYTGSQLSIGVFEIELNFTIEINDLINAANQYINIKYQVTLFGGGSGYSGEQMSTNGISTYMILP